MYSPVDSGDRRLNGSPGVAASPSIAPSVASDPGTPDDLRAVLKGGHLESDSVRLPPVPTLSRQGTSLSLHGGSAPTGLSRAVISRTPSTTSLDYMHLQTPATPLQPSTTQRTGLTPKRRVHRNSTSSVNSFVSVPKQPVPSARNFFDSPRSSFSKSYSASALRNSRTTLDDSDAIVSSEDESSEDDRPHRRIIKPIVRLTKKDPDTMSVASSTSSKVRFLYPDSTPGSPGTSSSMTAPPLTSTLAGSSLLSGSPITLPVPPVPPKNTMGTAPIFFRKTPSKRQVPKLRAFRRIADELQLEMYPMDQELEHESLITAVLKDEDEILSSNQLATSVLAAQNDPSSLQNDSLRRFEVISRANEAWNKHRPTSPTLTAISVEPNALSISNVSSLTRKRKGSIDESDASTYGGSDTTESHIGIKRRLVSLSNSPTLAPATFQHPQLGPGSKLVQSTSDDLELMSLK